MKKIFDFLFIPSNDISMLVSADVRRWKTLNVMLLLMLASDIMVLTGVLGSHIIFPGSVSDMDLVLLFIAGLIGLIGLTLIILLNRLVSSSTASAIFIVIIYIALLSSDTPHEIAYGRSLVFMVLPVVLATVLFRSWGGILAILINIAIISYIGIFYKFGMPNLPAIWLLFFISLLVWQSTSLLERALEQVQISNRSLLEAKEEVRQVNIGLEQRVAERTTELRAANDQLRAEITERKQAEESLRESEDKFKYLFDNSIIGKSFTMLSGEVNTNKAFCDMLGYTQAELQNKRWQDITHPDDIELTQREINLLISGEQDSVRFFKRFIHQDGSEVLVDLSSFIRRDNNSKPPYFITTLIDITEQRQAEEALKKSKEKYQLLIENMNAGVFQTNLSGKFLQMNSAVAKMAGYDSIDELMSKHASCLYANLADREHLKEMLATHGEVRNMELRSVKKDGTQYWISINAVLQKNKDGEPESIIGIVNDINEHKHVEEALRESESRFETIFRSSPIGIAISRVDDGVFLDANEAFLKMFGYDRNEVVNHAVAILPDLEEARRLFNELHLRGSVQQFEAKFLHKSGEIGDQQVSMELIELNGQKCVLGSTFNITKRKKLENELKEVNQQLESRVEQRTAELFESQGRMNKLARQVVTAQEEERKRISDELHDEAGHLLIGLRSPLDILYKDLLSAKDAHHQIAAKAMKLTDEVAERIRSLSYSLHPPMLEVLGLNMSIKSLCREFSENTGIQVDCDLDGANLSDIANEIDISLYRFVREALTNIHKHAHASNADVMLTHDKKTITVSVQDNGMGMKPISRDAYGIGLRTINERLDILGGKLKIESLMGGGTQVQAILPLNNYTDQKYKE
ncbi:MAG: PAS domain S-box protein [Chloroflexi bacterium]|nr:PAS domain S-box protein [Chloroflexota bacterium]